MTAQSISQASLICAGQSQRAATLRGERRAAPAAHGTEFHNGMLEPGRRQLAQGQLLSLPAIDATLVCLDGELWLTRDGDAEDYILGAGGSLHLRHNDQAAVQALRPSRLRLIPA
ncbi:MAG: DUF2917 domain-containing protein [Rhodocyclales bacterium]|nr:DUF2917 domain-containing protein [Rhodocyclales bacterium]